MDSNIVCPPVSPAAQILFSIVPIVGIVLGTTLLFFISYWFYKVRVKMLEQGYQPKISESLLNRLVLLIGLLSCFVGAPLTIIFILIDGLSYSILGGIIPFVSGIAFITYFKVMRNG